MLRLGFLPQQKFTPVGFGGFDCLFFLPCLVGIVVVLFELDIGIVSLAHLGLDVCASCPRRIGGQIDGGGVTLFRDLNLLHDCDREMRERKKKKK